MAGQWGDFKTVVSANVVSAEVDQQCSVFPRLREAWDALEWLLARSAARVGRAPNSGDQDLRLFVQEQDLLANVPAIWVIYRVGDHQIDILAVRIVPPIDTDSDID